VTKASDNIFPRLLVSEGGSTATPAADTVTVYAKADGLLYSKDDAGSETALGAGAATPDLVQVSSGMGSVVVPGFAGIADVVPGSPSAYDDEFDAYAGWTQLGSLDTVDVTTQPSHLRIKDDMAAVGVVGVYKAIPSMPFTVTAKISDLTLATNNQFAGIILTETSPGKVNSFGPVVNASTHTYSMYRWTNLTTYSTVVQANILGWDRHRYLRVVVASSTDVSFYVSVNGMVWKTIFAATDSLITIANVGLCIGDLGAHPVNEAYFDWIRFT